jgi:hypothetical protein
MPIISLEQLMYHGAQLNSKTDSDETLVDVAASYCDVKTVRTLEGPCVKGLLMDEKSGERYLGSFDERYNYFFRRTLVSPQVEPAAFQTVPHSIKFTAYVTDNDKHEDCNMPGECPVDLE